MRKPLCSYDATADLAAQIGPGETDYHGFDRRVAKQAAQWVSDPARKDAPWCAFVSLFSPHFPLTAPVRDYDRYNAVSIAVEPVPDHPILKTMWEFWDHDRHFDDVSRGIAHAAYKGLCTFVDRQLGYVIDALTASGQLDETLIIFTSDHGDMMGEHGFWSKSVMYENSARVPLILAGPGVSHGVCEYPVSLIDLAPTIAQAFDLDQRGYSGTSLHNPTQDRTVLSEYHDGGAPVGITMARWNEDGTAWKYVHYAEGHPPQVFNLTSDPAERDDLTATRPDVVTIGKQRLAKFFDPEEINLRAHADQQKRIAELGGRDALLAMEQWNFTPATSR